MRTFEPKIFFQILICSVTTVLRFRAIGLSTALSALNQGSALNPRTLNPGTTVVPWDGPLVALAPTGRGSVN